MENRWWGWGLHSRPTRGQKEGRHQRALKALCNSKPVLWNSCIIAGAKSSRSIKEECVKQRASYASCVVHSSGDAFCFFTFMVTMRERQAPADLSTPWMFPIRCPESREASRTLFVSYLLLVLLIFHCHLLLFFLFFYTCFCFYKFTHTCTV